MPERKCTSCKNVLPADLINFPPHKGCKYGLGPECRPCHRARLKLWKSKNSERLARRRRQLYAEKYGARQRELERLRTEQKPLQAQAARLMSGVRERSKQLGFDRPKELSQRQFFENWLQKQPLCVCCNIKFCIGFKNGIVRDDAPSIDRFNPHKGYALDNIFLICWRCNNIKRNYSAQDLQNVADWMRSVT